MQYCKCLIIACCSFFLSATSFAQSSQDMTGLWTGLMFNDTTELNYRYEIAISEKNGKLIGYSQTFFIIDGKEYYGVKKLKVSIDGDKIITQDLKYLDNNYPATTKIPKGVYVINVLNFEKKNNVMMLSGMFETNRTRQYAPATGYIHVERKIDVKESPLVQQLSKMGLVSELSFVPVEKPESTDVVVKIEIPKEQPIVKAEPVVKEKPAEEKIVKTKPAPEKEITKAKEDVVKQEPKKQPETKPKQDVVKREPQKIPDTKPKEDVVKQTPQKPQETKPPEEVVKKEPQKTPETKPGQAGKDINGRIIETIQSVNYKSDSLMITLYDNGEVDGDTVSVLMNGEVIMPMVGLSTKPVRKTIYTKDITDSIQIVMYAENLGSLPPNTGLLIVNDGKDRYEIRFSGDLKKNSAIVFKRKER